MDVLNSTTYSPQYDVTPHISKIVQSVIVLIIAVAGMIGNILNLITIPRIEGDTMGDAAKVFFVGLAVADFITAALLMISPVTTFNPGLMSGKVGHDSCIAFGYIMTCAAASSAWMIFLINLERYIHVTRPFTCESDLTKGRAIFAATAMPSAICFFVLLFTAVSEPPFGVIRYHEDLGICKVAFSEPKFLPYTLTMFYLYAMARGSASGVYVHQNLSNCSLSLEENRGPIRRGSSS